MTEIKKDKEINYAKLFDSIAPNMDPAFVKDDFLRIVATFKKGLPRMSDTSSIIPFLESDQLRGLSATEYSILVTKYTTNAGYIADKVTDLPLQSEETTSTIYKIKPIGNAHIYGVLELESNKDLGVNINTQPIEKLTSGLVKAMSELAWKGDSAVGLNGWLTNPDVERVQGIEWDGLSQTDLLQFVQQKEQAHRIKANISADQQLTLITDPDNLFRLTNTYYSNVSPVAMSSLFLSACPNLRLISSPMLKGAFTGGKNGFIIYEHDNTKFGQVMPVSPKLIAPQTLNLRVLIQMVATHGGTCVVDPDSQTFVEGI